MDFTKFIDLLDSSTLYFARIHLLDDGFEGSYPEKTFTKKKSMGLDQPNFYNELRSNTLINCWHMNDFESAAMWKLYLKSNEGISIQTTYNRIVSALNAENDIKIMCGTVKYIDYGKDEFDFSNTFNAFLHKRKSFDYERELRLLAEEEINPNKSGHELGIKVQIDLNELIENIYITPTAPLWFLHLIKSILSKYGLSKPVKQSDLNKSALI